MKSFKKILSSQAGFSLVEVMAAAAISITISLAMMKTSDTGRKANKAVSTNMDLKLWKHQILLQKLASPDACLATFSGTVPDSLDTSVTTLRTGALATTVFATTGTVLNNTSNNWKFLSVSRAAFKADDGASGLKGICDVEVEVERVNKKSFGASIKKIKFPLVCTKKNDGSWASCSAQSGNDSYWAQYINSGTGENYLHSQGEYVRIGASGQKPAPDLTDDIKSPLEISIDTGYDFPTGIAEGVLGYNGVSPSVNLLRNNAIILGTNSALYEDTSGCMSIASGSSGALENGIRHCSSVHPVHLTEISNVVSIASKNVNYVNPTYNSVVLGGSNVNMPRGSYNVAMGRNITLQGHSSYAIGNGIQIAHNENVVLGSTTGVGYNPSTLDNQFTAMFDSGFRFRAGMSNNESTFIDEDGHMSVGVDASSMGIDVRPKLYVRKAAIGTLPNVIFNNEIAILGKITHASSAGRHNISGVVGDVSNATAAIHIGDYRGIKGLASMGVANGTGGGAYGVYGEAGNAGENFGVYGRLTGSEDGVGVFGHDGTTSTGVIDDKYAGFFAGDVNVVGSIKADKYVVHIPIAPGSTYAGSIAGGVCIGSATGRYSDCYCSDADYEILNGGMNPSGAFPFLSESRPVTGPGGTVSMYRWRAACMNGSATRGRCSTVSLTCVKIKDRNGSSSY